MLDKAADLGVNIDTIGKSIGDDVLAQKKLQNTQKTEKSILSCYRLTLKNRQEPSNLNKVSVRSNTGKLSSINKHCKLL